MADGARDTPGTAREWWHPLRKAVMDPFDLTALVSLAVLVPSPQRAGVVASAGLAVVAAAVVILPAVRRAWWPWAVFAVFHVVTYVSGWYLLDNHDALVAYWAMALAVAAASRRERVQVLATQARLMIGVTFALAAAWKLLSEQFRSGDFFAFALLVDPRFRGVTELVAGVPVDRVHANAAALSEAAWSWRGDPVVQLAGIEAVAGAAVFLTVATIVVEAGVALTMLAPDGRRTGIVRSAMLAVFLVTTYLIVPVSRFGVLLAAMGVAQASATPRARMAFAIGAIVLTAWGSIWLWVVGLA